MKAQVFPYLKFVFFVGMVLWGLPEAALGGSVTVINETVVYSQPDYDAEEIYRLQVGQRVDVSHRVFEGKNGLGRFVRVRWEKGLLGFIAEDDIKQVLGKSQDMADDSHKQKNFSSSGVPFHRKKFLGFNFDYMGYKETIMGISPMSNLFMYGFKAVGFRFLTDVDVAMEFNANLFPSAPAFYSQETGGVVNGWLLFLDAPVESVFLQTSHVLTYVGLGPMVKYSRYNLAYNAAKNMSSYEAGDVNFGLVFNAGFGLNFGSTSLRSEIKYRWDKAQYLGLGFALLFPF